MKILLTEDNHTFLIRNTKADYHCQYGSIKKTDINKKAGAKISTNKGKNLAILDADFMDLFGKIKRGAQIIPMKDLGSIIVRTGLNKESVVVDAGTGSGSLCAFLAYHAKKVTSYDIRDDHIAIGLKNKELLGLDNLTIKKHDIYEGIKDRKVDVITLDVPEPWKALVHAEKALKVGGNLVAYCPTVPQMIDFVQGVENSDKMAFLNALEIVEREWEVKGRKVRPFSRIIAHSGFLIFSRKIYR